MTEARIDLEALRANGREAIRLAEGREVIAVVKADGYGHGAARVARALLEVGCGRLAVFSIAEAAELRAAALGCPILVLGGVHSPEEAGRASHLQLTPVLHHRAALELVTDAAAQAGRQLRVQVEVDTGMSRMGLPLEEALAFLERVVGEPKLELDGLMTHLTRADESDLAPSLEQLGEFRKLLAEARGRGIEPTSIHVMNSAGLMAGKTLADSLPEATAVRPGLMLYGVRPAAHLEAALQPVMSVRSRVIRVQDLAPGASVGYGGTYSIANTPGRQPSGRTRIATLPIGYADGVPCSTGNRGQFWIAGRRFPIAGRVSMDSVAVDVGEASVEIGDEAVFFGNATRDANGIAVEEAAQWAETIPYELLVRVGDRIARCESG